MEPSNILKSTTKKAWSQDQEISILNAMIQFTTKGLNPSAYVSDFYAFIKQTQTVVDFSQNEVLKKLIQMRKNYRETLIKSPEEIFVSSDPHQNKILSLSKQIWGGFATPEGTSEICLKGMRKFHEKNVGLEEKAIKERLKVMKKKKRGMYVMKLREIEKMEMKLNLKRAEIVNIQMKFFLDAYDEILRE